VQTNHHRGFVLANILKTMLEKKQKKDQKRADMLKRVEKNKLYEHCLYIVKHQLFSIIMAGVIIANTVVQALDKYPEN
jgi:hypothetical protein